MSALNERRSGLRTRREKREQFDAIERVRLLEDDMDDADATQLRIEGKVDRMSGILMGVLITLATSTVLLGLNLMVGTGQ